MPKSHTNFFHIILNEIQTIHSNDTTYINIISSYIFKFSNYRISRKYPPYDSVEPTCSPHPSRTKPLSQVAKINIPQRLCSTSHPLSYIRYPAFLPYQHPFSYSPSSTPLFNPGYKTPFKTTTYFYNKTHSCSQALS